MRKPRKAAKTELWWLSSRKMTVGVETRIGYPHEIVKAPPIVKRFIGQGIHSLINWMLLQGDFRYLRQTR